MQLEIEAVIEKKRYLKSTQKLVVLVRKISFNSVTRVFFFPQQLEIAFNRPISQIVSVPKPWEYLFFYVLRGEGKCSHDMVIFLALVTLRSKETCSDLKHGTGRNLLSENDVLTHR